MGACNQHRRLRRPVLGILKASATYHVPSLYLLLKVPRPNQRGGADEIVVRVIKRNNACADPAQPRSLRSRPPTA
ncbi:unnamed protein product, partial [Iphiclides podalirius]